MEKICIFTDSSADIPKEEVEKFGIEIIPILVTAGDRTFREYFDITPEEYWKLLRESEEIPSTAQTTVQDCLTVFRRAHDAGCTHVIMEVSSHALTLSRVDTVRFQVGVFTLRLVSGGKYRTRYVLFRVR